MRILKYKIKEFRQMEPGEVLAAAEAYIAQRKEDYRLYRNAWEKAHVEDRRKYMVEYRRERRRLYPEKVKAEDQKFRAQNPQLAREAGRRWRENNREANRERIAAWRALNRDKIRAAERRHYYRSKSKRIAQTDPTGMQRLIVSKLPSHVLLGIRNEVAAELMMEMLTGKVDYREIEIAAKRALTSYNRQYDYFKNVSIDAPIAGTDGLTRGDMLSNETPHF
ncbi:hypothetical protein [Brucella anthropi]|uniref:hypothetical protein n=1 Tax=Brucella anthropi TaxID=529 RepID=UPI0005BE452B|nr:hypothetical protein [Brucella anthropi]KIU65223.1 hypothetical protein TR92_21115 [Brucella anthropi]